ncbi:MAG TPA: MgtC/SapB family protein [Burkholderiales bacterium]|nr:MgtC/SapB family protein [Burkholderiales bacterium]
MERDYIVIIEHLLIALGAGGIIGLERSYHGRPAGFRTHALVCVASSALMLVTVYQSHWYPETFAGRVALDPTRMAQGIMTGIGFLGAGVIFKEGLTVRGLTTAASIWITAAIGILAGIGFYFPLAITTVLTLLTLSVFRWVESKLPGDYYGHLEVRFSRGAAMPEDEFRRFLREQGFSIANLSYRYSADASFIEYRMVVRTSRNDDVKRLAESLETMKSVVEFRMFPAGD